MKYLQLMFFKSEKYGNSSLILFTFFSYFLSNVTFFKFNLLNSIYALILVINFYFAPPETVLIYFQKIQGVEKCLNMLGATLILNSKKFKKNLNSLELYRREQVLKEVLILIH